MVVTVAFVLPFVVVATMLVRALMPLWTGLPVVVDVVGRDPRDLMAGDYVMLNYAFSRVRSDSTTFEPFDPSTLRYGDHIYVSMTKQGDVWKPVGVAVERPAEGTFLHGRVVSIFPLHLKWQDSPHYTIDIAYGIEAYYTDPETAKALERRILSLRRDTTGGTLRAELRVDADGDARIVAIH